VMDGMMLALIGADMIADRCPGMTASEAFWSKANLPNIRFAIEEALEERALIPTERLH
jgi:hypothetical protein